MTVIAPSTKGDSNGNGRGKGGRFAKGWKGGPGNPLGGKVNKLRSALVNAVTEDDIRAIAERLVKEAKNGSVRAAHEVFDRIFGKASQPIQLTGEDGKSPKVKVLHSFDHERYRNLFYEIISRRIRSEPSRADDGNGDRESIHSDHPN